MPDLQRFFEIAAGGVELTGIVLLVVIRTFLSFSLEVELSGRWPWQDRAPARGSD